MKISKESNIDLNRISDQLPVGMKLMKKELHSVEERMSRFVSSENYKSSSMFCSDFYKPISRVIDPNEDAVF